MDAIRVGLIGYGFAGKVFHAPLIRADPRLRLVAVASSRPDEVRAELGPVAVFADPAALAVSGEVDLVVIASPNQTHAPLAAAAIAAGRHVVVDKPFTLTLGEARELRDLAADRGVALSVFQNRRWDSDFLTVRDAIAAGLVGRVAGFESRIDRFRPAVRDRWREADVPGAGLLYDLGPHLIDQALCLFGPPERVTAQLGRQRDGALADDSFRLVLGYRAMDAILSASMLVGGGTPRFAVHGAAGSLIKAKIDSQEDQLRAGMAPGADGWGVDPDAAIFHDGAGGTRGVPASAGDQRGFYAALARALLDGGPVPVPAGEAVAVMAVIEAARVSAADGSGVPLALTPEEHAVWAERATAGRL